MIRKKINTWNCSCEHTASEYTVPLGLLCKLLHSMLVWTSQSAERNTCSPVGALESYNFDEYSQIKKREYGKICCKNLNLIVDFLLYLYLHTVLQIYKRLHCWLILLSNTMIPFKIHIHPRLLFKFCMTIWKTNISWAKM
jgi:hypothetical protein